MACLLFLFFPSISASSDSSILAVDDLKIQIEGMIKTNAEYEKRIAKLEAIITDQTDDPEIDARLLHLEALTRTKLKRSCHELAMQGVSKSDIYEIDPDGEAKGEPPIEVYCNFVDGFTEILHNADNLTWSVPHCEEEFCAETNYTYTAPMNQIQALIELSSTCSQEIIFDCFLAPLFYNDVDIGAWTDRWGEKQFYFEGSNYGAHMCACDNDDSCYGSETFANTCNCDNTFEHEWKQDRGSITNKTALPITAFNYGFLVYDVMEAMVHVGRLRCSGEANHSPVPHTCRDLKMSGQQQSGLFLLEDADNNNFPLVTKCDMTGPSYDEVSEVRLGWQQFSTGPDIVTFAASNSLNYEGPPEATIEFDETIVNQGNAFLKDTFTAPVDGLYEFSFSALSTGGGGHHFVIDIMVQGQLYQTLMADNYQFTTLSKAWTLTLNRGSTVALVLREGAFYGEDMRAQFAGKLV